MYPNGLQGVNLRAWHVKDEGPGLQYHLYLLGLHSIPRLIRIKFTLLPSFTLETPFIPLSSFLWTKAWTEP